MKIKLTKLRCRRCDWTWIPRKEKKPVVCPNCHSPYWDKERKSRKIKRR